jgi:hypothetical protein
MYKQSNFLKIKILFRKTLKLCSQKSFLIDGKHAFQQLSVTGDFPALAQW